MTKPDNDGYIKNTMMALVFHELDQRALEMFAARVMPHYGAVVSPLARVQIVWEQ